MSILSNISFTVEIDKMNVAIESYLCIDNVVYISLIQAQLRPTIQIVDGVEVTIGNYLPEVGNTARRRRRRVVFPTEGK